MHYTLSRMKISWTVIFHSNTEHWGVGRDYNEEEDALRIDVKSLSLPMSIETFTIDLNNLKDDHADLLLMWDQTMVAVPIHFNTNETVLSTIDKTMAGPSSNDYFQSRPLLF